jgi:hypothetical protein
VLINSYTQKVRLSTFSVSGSLIGVRETGSSQLSREEPASNAFHQVLIAVSKNDLGAEGENG